jgi:hypothetical protein
VKSAARFGSSLPLSVNCGRNTTTASEEVECVCKRQFYPARVLQRRKQGLADLMLRITEHFPVDNPECWKIMPMRRRSEETV